MRYVVATDGSEQADEAIEYAATHATALDATLDIVHVLAPKAKLVDGEIIYPGGDTEIEDGERTLEQADRLATELAAEEDVDLTVNTQLLSGRPADAVTDYASENDADAIYVGHRGLSKKREKVTGSVAKTVVDNADIPVTVVR